MTQCPSPECHESLRLCLKDKVSKKALWKIVTAFGVPALIFAGTTYYYARSADLKFARNEVVSAQTVRVSVLESQMREMACSLNRIERNQEEFRRDIKTLLQRTANREAPR